METVSENDHSFLVFREHNGTVGDQPNLPEQAKGRFMGFVVANPS